MKLLVVGNSHCYALKNANDAEDGPLKGQVSFMCSPGRDLALEISDGVMTCTSEVSYVTHADGGTAPHMVIDDHDAVAVVGLNLHTRQVVRMFQRGIRPFPYEARARVLLSRPAFVAALSGLMEGCMAIRIAMQLRRHTDRPIIVVPQPKPLARIAEPGVTPYRLDQADRWKDFLEDEAKGRDLEGLFEQAMVRLCHRHGLQFIRQPEETLDGIFTRNEFQVRYKNSFDAQAYIELEKEDFTHMNADYGRIVLEALKDTVETHMCEAQAVGQ